MDLGVSIDGLEVMASSPAPQKTVFDVYCSELQAESNRYVFSISWLAHTQVRVLHSLKTHAYLQEFSPGPTN